MTIKERIKELANERKISLPALESELGFGNSTIVKWDKSTPSVDKLQKVARYFHVTLDYLVTGKNNSGDYITCPECGLSYISSYKDDIKYHCQEHLAWEKAVKKFGNLYCSYEENERIKAENRNISHDLSASLSARYEAQIEVLRCLFSRSITANHFDLNHVSFEKYIAMMLNNERYCKNLDSELCQKLINTFGTLPGINNGESYYFVPEHNVQTIAAHKENGNFTPEELDKIEEYKRLLLAARPKNNGDD